MFNVCKKCGIYNAKKIIDIKESVAICPNCGEKHIFKRGKIGNADSKLINQRELVHFAHQWYDEKINNS